MSTEWTTSSSDISRLCRSSVVLNKICSTFLCSLMLVGTTSASQMPEVCREIVKQKQPAAYLVDVNDTMVQGPVELGTVELANDVDDEQFTLSTGYRVVVRPLALDVRTPFSGMGYGASLVPEKKSLCAGTRTYRIVLNWVRSKGEVRPYAFEAPLPEFELADKFGYGEDVANLYRFDARVVGNMINPRH